MISQKAIKTYAICIIAIWAVIILVILSFLNPKDHQISQVPFDSNEWKNMKGEYRYTMYDDLVNNHTLIGMDCSAIEQLLGEMSVGYDPDGDASNKNYYWGYTIRYDDFEGYEVLLIHFENNTVTELKKVYLEYL
jgi:hypothetical protein